MTSSTTVLEQGQLSFTIESRIIRELGERLVKQPEIAILELIKNSYDADATSCRIVHRYPEEIRIADDGHGMTLDEFKNGWMRIGTSSKEAEAFSRSYGRVITGEKNVTAHGSSEMPSWGTSFRSATGNQAAAEARINLLVTYIQSIQR